MSTTNEPTDIALWWWSLDQPTEVVALLEASLDSDEQIRADSLINASIRQRFIIGRGGMRCLLSNTLGVEPRAVPIGYGPAGKPRIKTPAKSTHFNLAHSGEIALFAIASEPIGVDLELIRPLKDAKGMAQRWFSPAEQQRIAVATQSEQLRSFFQTWVAKEAVLKLLGLGVGESLPRLETPTHDAIGRASSLPTNELAAGECWVQPIPLHVDYTAALASLGSSTRITVKELPGEQLAGAC